MKSGEPYKPDEADVAAEDGRWPDALRLRLGAIKAQALGKLQAGGAFSPENLATIETNLSAIADPKDLAALQQKGIPLRSLLGAQSISVEYLAAFAFIDARPEPSYKDPLSAEDAAAMFVLQLSEFEELFAEVGKSMSERPFDMLCKLVLISANMGVLTEAFRAEMAGFASPMGWAAARAKGGLRGGETKAKNADRAWRKQALEIALNHREANPASSAADVRRAINKVLIDKGVPQTRGLEKQIKKWEDDGQIPRQSEQAKA
jgi:hypothetical protein